MKSRVGFVSNSSSSSYVIAVNQASKVCECCGRSDAFVFETIYNLLKSINYNTVKIENGNKYYDHINVEIDNHETTILEGNRQLKQIKRARKNKELLSDYITVKNQFSFIKDKMPLSEASCYTQEKIEDTLNHREDVIKNEISNSIEKLKKYERIKKEIEEYLSKGYDVYQFQVDNWHNIMRLLESNNDNLKVIDKTNDY